jgi:multiple sugar transport system permease protein
LKSALLGDRLWRPLTLGPTVAVFAALTVMPVVGLTVMSLHDVAWVQGLARWTYVGDRHLRALPQDQLFRAGLANTVLFALVAVAVQMTVGFALALASSKVSRGGSVYRAVFVLPILVPGIVIGAIWKLMYNYDFGVFNQMLTAIGLAPANWLGSTSLALWSVVLVDVWHWVPFVFLILFAAVEALPIDVLEAARVDGATRWQLLRRVILPLLWPAIVVAMLFRTIHAFKVFDEVYLLTSGGPGTSTELLTLHLYKVFFEQNQLGYGALLSLALIAAVVAFLLVGARATQAARA